MMKKGTILKTILRTISTKHISLKKEETNTPTLKKNDPHNLINKVQYDFNNSIQYNII